MERILFIIGTSLLSLGAAGIGTWLLVRCLLATVWGIKSKSWPIVEGVINTSSIYEMEDYDSGGASLGVIGHMFGIEYSYEFAGVKHTSRQVSIGEERWLNTFGSKEKAEERQAKYPAGTKVKVYCDPKRPQLSTLETGFKPKTIIGLLLGILNIGWGTFVIFFLVLPGILSH